MVAGDYHILSVTVTMPSGMTLQDCTIKWALYKRGVVLEKKTEDGITIKGDDIFEVEIAAGETTGMAGLYQHEAEITDASGHVVTVMRGNVEILRELVK